MPTGLESLEKHPAPRTDVSVEDNGAHSSWLRRNAISIRDYVILAVAPLLFFFSLRVVKFDQNNGLDPFIYVGYGANFSDLISRFGFPYYSVRAGLILPAVALNRLFPPVEAFYVMRYLLALVAVIPLFVLLRKISGRPVAFAAAFLLLLNPVFIKSLMTMYGETVGVPLLVTVFCLLLYPRGRHDVPRLVLAGVCIGWAANANLFTLGLSFCACLTYAIVNLRSRRIRVLFDGAWVLSGIAGVFAMFALIYKWKTGTANILRPSLDAISTYSGEAGDAFRAQDYLWLNTQSHLYVAPLVLGTLIILRFSMPARSESVWRFADAAMIALGLVIALPYIAYNFLGNGNSMELYYYAAYVVAPVALGVGAVLARLVDACDWHTLPRSVRVGGPVLLGSLPLLVSVLRPTVEFWAWQSVPALALTLVAFTVISSRHEIGKFGIGAVMAVTVLFLPMTGSMFIRPQMQDSIALARYRQVYGYDSTDSLDTFRFVNKFIDTMPRYRDGGGSLVFWFNNRSISAGLATFPYVSLRSSLSTVGPWMPELDYFQKTRLNYRTPRYIAVLAETPAQRDEAEAVLRREGPEPLSVEYFDVSEGAYFLSVALVEYVESECDSQFVGRSQPWLAYPLCPELASGAYSEDDFK